MGIDRLIFRKPAPSYTQKSIEEQENIQECIHWIPHNSNPNGTNSSKPISHTKFPVLVMSYLDKHAFSTDQVFLFFHGNAEDLGMTRPFLRGIRTSLCMNAIAMEYPGYGIYTGKKPNARQIKEDALSTYDYLVNVQGIPEEKIIICGRSIGSGPACEVASKRKPGKVILLSAFTSIKKLASEISFSLVSYFVKERFNNIGCVGQFRSPCILIHGSNDKLIKPEHSQELFNGMQKTGYFSKLEIRQTMTHNTFQLLNDIVYPIQRFLKEIKHQPLKVYPSQLPNIFAQTFLGKEERKLSALTNYSESPLALEFAAQAEKHLKDKKNSNNQQGKLTHNRLKHLKNTRHIDIPQQQQPKPILELQTRSRESTNNSTQNNNLASNQQKQQEQQLSQEQSPLEPASYFIFSS